MFNLVEVMENLKREEGWSATVYDCSEGYETIGYGRNISSTGPGITKEEGEFLLANDIARCVDELEKALPWVSGCDRIVANVLVELCYQLGLPTLLKFKLTLNHLQQDQFEAGADELLRSRFAKQTPARALRLAGRLRSAQQ
tara:strand:+ start:353 stop:778 length:426 start_codon:yes stop_codon:yes gene_type:complete